MRAVLAPLLIAFASMACIPQQRLAPLCDASARSRGCQEGRYDEAKGAIPNPERGFFVVVELGNDGDIEWAKSLDRRLVNVRVLLAEFQHRDLSPERLQVMDEGFAKLRRAGLKAVLRFQYNLGSGIDAGLPQVLAHIEQLTPLLRKNSDVIAVLQAGFIGAWGEWHASSSGLDSPEAKNKILDALLTALPPERQLQVRTPFYKADYLGGAPLSEATAYDGSARARIGHHNDCLLATHDDNGTYEDDVEGWRNYVKKESPFVAIGGEACESGERTSCAQARRELSELHWSYLNGGFPEDVIQKWKRDGCYDEFDERLGYRLVLHGSSWTLGEGTLDLVVDIENRGYAAPFNPRPVFLVLYTAERRYDLPIALDPRQWQPGLRKRYRISLSTEGIDAGRYEMALWLPDAERKLRNRSEYSIRFANEDMWSSKRGLNRLSGAIVIPASTNAGD